MRHIYHSCGQRFYVREGRDENGFTVKSFERTIEI
jgi:hypothetical protein